ncbi:hypothetical protein [Xanthobacter tagetidis]
MGDPVGRRRRSCGPPAAPEAAAGHICLVLMMVNGERMTDL